ADAAHLAGIRTRAAWQCATDGRTQYPSGQAVRTSGARIAWSFRLGANPNRTTQHLGQTGPKQRGQHATFRRTSRRIPPALAQPGRCGRRPALVMSLASRRRRGIDFWPGFVDALTSLLMVLIFMLLIFTIGQFVLSDALSGRDKALAQLNAELAQLAKALSM